MEVLVNVNLTLYLPWVLVVVGTLIVHHLLYFLP